MKIKLFIAYAIIDFVKAKILKKKCSLCGKNAIIFEYKWFCKNCFINEFDINKISDWWK